MSKRSEAIADAEDYAHTGGLEWPQVLFVLLVAFVLKPVRFIRSLLEARKP